MTELSQFQWNELNLRRNYPFTDASTLKAKTKLIPKEWAIDATLVPNRVGTGTQYYFLSKILKEGNKITITLSDQIGELAQAVFDIKSQNTHIKFYHTVGGRYAGSLIVNPMYNVSLGSFDEGETRMGNKAVVFIPSVVHPVPSPSVTAVKASGSDGASVGEVYIVGDEGVLLSKSLSGNIRVDISGDPNYARYDCDTGQIPYNLQAIKNIVPCVMMNNGTVHVGPAVTADAQGSFMILPSNTQDTGESTPDDEDMYTGTKPSLRIYPQSGQLYFEIAGLGRSL